MSTLQITNLKNASSGSNNIVLGSDGTTTIAAPSNIIKSGTAVASTSGTAIDFTGIPSWAKRITVMFSGVSTNGTSSLLVQLGSGSVATTGYTSGAMAAQATASSSAASTSTAGILAAVTFVGAADVMNGFMNILNVSGNNWLGTAVTGNTVGTRTTAGTGTVTLSGTLDRVRITTVNSTDTFDAGSINILYEG
jgi:hypothetical protein